MICKIAAIRGYKTTFVLPKDKLKLIRREESVNKLIKNPNQTNKLEASRYAEPYNNLIAKLGNNQYISETPSESTIVDIRL